MSTFKQGYALVVGTGGDLPSTVDDAKALAGILIASDRCAYPSDQVHLLTGPGATRQAVLSGLDKLAKVGGVEEEATVVIYFSGHGYCVESSMGTSYLLLPHGYDLDNPARTCINGAEFTARLRTIAAQKLLVLLDCCRAGGIGEPKSPGLTFVKSPLPPEAEAILAEGQGRVIIASSRQDELSYAGKPYSAFTIALLESLSGREVDKKDGYVRVSDLALHAREVVPQRTGGKQHPTIKFHQADNFAVAYYAAGAKEPQPLAFPLDLEFAAVPEPDTPVDQRDVRLSGSIFFVNRQPIVAQFHQILQHSSPQWILVVGGSKGIGKTAVLNQLVYHCPQDTIAISGVNFASHSLRSDPLSLLDTLEHELTGRFQGWTFEEYRRRRKRAHGEFEQAYISVMNLIKARTGGVINVDTIVQNVELSKALYERQIRMRTDLTRDFAEAVGNYLNGAPEVRIALFLDDFDSLRSSVDGQEYADWCLGQLLGGIYRRAPFQLRVVVSDLESLRWLKSVGGRDVVRHELQHLSPNQVYDYLQQRSITGRELQQTIYELTQGHPLCVALAADLCVLDPGLTASELKKLSLSSFDSEALAYRLFQSIIDHETDKAKKRLLEYGPVFRVINDTVVRQIVAPETELVGREDELLRAFRSMRGFFFVEGTEDLSFKPVIRDRHLELLRREYDDLYRSISYRATELYRTRSQQAQTREERQASQLDALYHQFSLEPRSSRRQWERMAEEAICALDYQQLIHLLDLAQSADFGWSYEGTSRSDRGIIKGYESRYYYVTGRSEKADETLKIATEFMDERRPSRPEPKPPQPEPKPSPGLVERFASVLSQACRGIVNWFTSPVRRLERCLRRLQRILELDRQIRLFVHQGIRDVDRQTEESRELRDAIANTILPQANKAIVSAQQLMIDVGRAQRKRDAHGRIPPQHLSTIENGIVGINPQLNLLNSKMIELRRNHGQLKKTVSKNRRFHARLKKKREKHTRESTKLQRQSSQLMQRLDTMADRLSPEEVRRVHKIANETRECSLQREGLEEDLQHDLDRYRASVTEAEEVLRELNKAVESVNTVMSLLNKGISRFNGMEFVSTDGELLRITLQTRKR